MWSIQYLPLYSDDVIWFEFPPTHLPDSIRSRARGVGGLMLVWKDTVCHRKCCSGVSLFVFCTSRHWRPGQPDSWTQHGLGPGDEDCAHLGHDGRLNDLHCSSRLRFICQKHSERS